MSPLQRLGKDAFVSDGALEFGVGVETSQAGAQLNQLKRDVEDVTSRVLHLSKVITQHFETMTKKLGSMPSASYQRGYLKSEAMGLNTQAGGFGPGVRVAQVDAATKAAINQINNSWEQATARVAQAHLQATKRALESSDAAIMASAQRTASRVQRDIARANNPAYQQGLNVRQDFQDYRTVRTGQIGVNAAAMENTLNRLGVNGGSDMMAIQARVLVGYQALSATFNTLRRSTQFVIGLDREFKQFQAITRTTNTEMESLEKRLISVSEKTKFTALEVAQDATVMGQAGLSARQVSEAIEPVTLLATAAGTGLAPAVDLVTSNLSIFNLQASQTADVANVMTAAINGSKLTIDKLALGFQYAGNIAAQSGITYTELTATLGALANSGIRSGSTLGTGLRQLLVDLQTPTEKFEKVLKRLGLTQSDVDVSSRGLVPVLKSLMDAGFSTADAFESFEVRAAASFTALTNNIDVISKLQKEFVLSSAAAEANEVQMRSLANTFDKLKSVLGTTAYNGMKPFIFFLQQMANSAAEAISVLNRYPIILEAISLSLVAIGSFVGLNAFGAVLSGLSKGLPVVSTFRTALLKLQNTTVATGTAAAVSTGILRAFFAVISEHPFMLAATAAATLATAIIAFSKNTDDAIDRAKALVATLEGQFNKTKEEMEAVDEVIGRLIQRKDELDRDPLMREAKILEVIQQFKELGLEIDASRSSVQDLINALNGIKEVNFGRQLETLTQQIAASQALADLLEARARTSRRDNGSDTVKSATWFIKNDAALGGFARSNDRAGAVSAGLTAAFGGDPRLGRLLEATSLALDPSVAIPENSSHAGALGEMVKSMAEEFSNRLELTRLTGGTKEEISLLQRQIDVLQSLDQTMQSFVTILINRDSALANREAAEAQRRTTEIGQALTAGGFATALQNTAGFLTTQANSSQSYQEQESTTTEQALVSARTVRSLLESELRKAMEISEVIKASLTANGYTPEEVDVVIKQIMSEKGIPELQNRIRQMVEESGETSAKVDRSLREQQQRVLDKEIQTIMKRVGNVVDRDSLDSIISTIESMFDQKRALTEQIFDDKLIAEGDKAAREILDQERLAARAVLDEEEAQMISRVSDRIQDVIRAQYKASMDTLAVEIKGIESELKLLTDQIKKSSPGTMMDALVARYNELLVALGQAMVMSQTLETNQSFLSGSRVDLGSVSADATGAMRGLMGMGWTQAQSAGIVGNLIAESGLSPTVWGDNGTSFGIAQWHKERLEAMKLWASVNQLDYTKFESQMRYLDHELRTSERASGDRIRASKTAEEAARAMFGFERFQGWNQPGVNDHWKNQRIQYAMNLAGVELPSDPTAEARSNLNNAVDAATLRSVTRSSSLEVRQSNAQINSILASAKAASDPARVRTMIDAVNSEFNQIVEAEVAKFREANKKAISENDPEVADQLADLEDRINTDRSGKLATLINEYERAYIKSIEEPLVVARRKLEEAQKPENAGKYSTAEIRQLQTMVYNQEQALLAASVAAAEEKLKLIRDQLAEATKRSGENSAEAIRLKEMETEAEKRLTDAMRERGIVQEAVTRGSISMGQAFNNAADSYRMSTGLFRQVEGGRLQMLSMAEQMQSVFTTVFDTLGNGLNQFFMNLSSGTMSIGESFKALGLTVVQMFMQMIAKALTYQIMLQLIQRTQQGMAGGGGGGFFGILSSLLTVPGMMNGGMIRAMNGLSTIPNRDSVPILAEPGEMLLRRSAVSMIGQENLTHINNMGNRRLSQSMPEIMQGQEQGVVNVYVISPDQQPSLGPNDIVATIADNINRKGPIRQLIRSVQMGAV